MPTAIELLTSQHRQVEKQLSKLEAAKTAKQRRALFREVADSLAAHVMVEETLFYPAVKAKRTEDKLLESLEEHLGIKRVLADLVGLDVDDETFPAKVKVLEEQVVHHHGEEEDDLFPKVKQLLDKDDLEALGDAMASAFVTLLAGRPRQTVRDETERAAPL
jgi:hemerythrin superfamily protein